MLELKEDKEMTKVKEDYIVGLDIGTNSCGWVATDMRNKILRLHGKNAIGARLFEAGKSAADRRGFRTTRRRIKRRKWRIGLLQEIFAPYIAEVDPNFFARLKESGISSLDSRKKFKAIIFPDRNTEKEFYKDYPTIYHLRNKLMTEDRKFDLREVYLAIHHIVKYRGNFLQDTPVQDFNATKIDVKKTITEINQFFAEYPEEKQLVLNVNNAQKISQIIRDDTVFKQDKVKQIAKLLTDSKNKSTKNVAKQIANAIFGYKTKFDQLVEKEVSKDDSKAWAFKLTDVDADVKLDQIMNQLDENQQAIINQVQGLFRAINLSSLVDEGKTFSATMVARYNQHHKDLKKLKQVIYQLNDVKKAKNLRLAYDSYVRNRHSRLLKHKKVLKTLTREEFLKEVEKNLDDSTVAKLIKEEIKRDIFMPKQRNNKNGSIPIQLHQRELDKIIENQSKYYPFLAEKNPVESHQKQAPYRIDELIRFRVPYYVGPMIAPQANTKNKQTLQNQSFAWMVRKEAGPINPWNFDEKVDRIASANRFIKRMTTKDTYLLAEDVLPANSLLYQRFEVLNELNNIRVNGKRLSKDVKQNVFNGLFKKQTTVSANNLETYLKQNYKLSSVEIKGLADNERFNSSLSTYNKLKKIKSISEQIDQNQYQTDFEKIIEWSTIFEDRKIFKEKLREIKWLNSKQIDDLANLRFQGWGRLSKKLLTGLHDHNGQNIIEVLWDEPKNLMQIINQADFAAAITKENQKFTEAEDINDFLDQAYTSPANKKAIRQVLKVVADITKAAGNKPPKQIAIEFAREAEKDPHLVPARGRKLSEAYQAIADDLVEQSARENLDTAIRDSKLAKDKYYLYFMQGGRDAYSGKKIDIDQLYKYDIDHILPQAFIKDDSFDNRVLVEKALNAEKSDDVPVKHFGNKLASGEDFTIRQLWQKWYEAGLITKHKLNNLTLDPTHLNKYQKAGFINRQLVETSQIIKLVATILQSQYPNTEIISVKASYNHILRKSPLYNLYKSREVNDYHHAIDAYLSTICANFLYQVYPNLRSFFVYGRYQKFEKDQKNKDEIIKNQRTFNFVWKLLKKDAPNEIYDSNGKQVFDRQKDIIDPLTEAYQYKHMLISHEIGTRDQEMFKMTLFPRADRDSKKRKLISRGKDMPVEIYGGYTGNTDAYLAIIKEQHAKEDIYRVVGVPMRCLSKLNKIKDNRRRSSELKELLTSQIIFNEKGKRKTAIKDFEIIRAKVPYRQLVIDGEKKFMLGSSTYVYNAKQLVLSPETMKIVTNSFTKKDYEGIEKDKNLLSSWYLQAYDEILAKVNKYLPLFDINKFRTRLNNGRDKFAELNEQDQHHDLIEILNGLHDNAVTGNLKDIGFTTNFGMMQMPSGITLSANAKLVFQSPTGLFEKKVKITNL